MSLKKGNNWVIKQGIKEDCGHCLMSKAPVKLFPFTF